MSDIKEYSLDKLKELVIARDINALKAYMQEYDLVMSGQKIVPKNKKYYMDQYEYWDMMQLIKKIMLNSLYGAVLNEGSRWFDSRMGQSVTLTGRCIVRHMMSKINELVTGDYNHLGTAQVYGDTDSCPPYTMITTNKGIRTIEELYFMGNERWQNGGKHYTYNPELRVLSYDPVTQEPRLMPTQYVYRHKVSKARWKVTDEFGNEVEMTNDHSVMIERDGILMEAKPSEIQENDLLISLHNVE